MIAHIYKQEGNKTQIQITPPPPERKNNRLRVTSRNPASPRPEGQKQ